MDNVKGILIIVCLALAAVCFLLFIRNGSLSNQVSDATYLSNSVLDLLEIQEIKCPASAGRFEQIAVECVNPYLLEKDFKGDDLQQPRGDTPGHLVIVNKNARTYKSENFRFEFNRGLLQNGCTIPGDIGKDVTCKFIFENTCEPGDILEVYYDVEPGDSRRVFLHTC